MRSHRWILTAGSLSLLACNSSGSKDAPDGGSSSSVGSSGDAASKGGGGSTTDGGAAGGGTTGGGKSVDGGASTSGGGTPTDPTPGDDGGTLSNCAPSAATADNGPDPAPGVVTGMVPGPGTFIDGCQIFPATNAWNVNVSSTSIPVITSQYTGLPASTHLHPDLGDWSTNGYGIPYNIVPSSQPDVKISFTCYASESDPGPNGWITAPGGSGGNCGEGVGVTDWPFPNGMKIEGRDPPTTGTTGNLPGDQHALVLQQGATCASACTLWETWNTIGGTTAPWEASNGAKWDLMSNALRPAGETSADAAGLSVFAGLLKLAELKTGVINHAIRVTFNHTYAAYVPPATHFAGTDSGPTYPPMGLRLRLKASFDDSNFTPAGKIVATTLKTYGLIVADIGSDWYFQGDSDDGWLAQDPNGKDSYVDELVSDFEGVLGSDFDVLNTGTPVTQ